MLTNTPEQVETLYDIDVATSKETAPSTLEFVPLVGMEAQEENAFKEKLAKSQGVIQVWVHTHYDENVVAASGQEKPLAEYKHMRDLSLRTNTEVMPVVAFIEAPPGFELELERYRE